MIQLTRQNSSAFFCFLAEEATDFLQRRDTGKILFDPEK